MFQCTKIKKKVQGIMSNKIENKNYNIGICLLRLLMSFIVVSCHYYAGNIVIISLMKNLAVPVFMLIAFMYFKNILSDKGRKIIGRLKRLLYPYVIWPIIYWLLYNALYFFLKWDGYRATVNSLLWQIAFGGSPDLMPQYWYMFDLIVLTIFMLAGYYHRGGVMLICFVCILFQYLNVNIHIFGGFRFEIKYSLGRIMEMFPYAAIGIFLGDQHFLNRCAKKRFLSLFLLVISACIVVACNMFSIIKNPDTGYQYQGINLILISVILVSIFYLLPFDQINDTICSIIYNLSQYSLGIYSLHLMVGKMISTILKKNGLACDSLLLCILIFALSLFMCCIISKLPYKWCKKIVT